eukprot:symbB.v1.2.036591.t1/scaffold5200.1/size29896/4
MERMAPELAEQVVFTNKDAAAKYKNEVEKRMEKMLQQAALVGKASKRELAATRKAVLEIMADKRYQHACKVVKGLEPKFGKEKEEEARPVEIESKAEETLRTEKEEEAQPVEIESKEEENVEEKEEPQPVQGKEQVVHVPKQERVSHQQVEQVMEVHVPLIQEEVVLVPKAWKPCIQCGRRALERPPLAFFGEPVAKSIFNPTCVHGPFCHHCRARVGRCILPACVCRALLESWKEEEWPQSARNSAQTWQVEQTVEEKEEGAQPVEIESQAEENVEKDGFIDSQSPAWNVCEL